MLGKFTFKGLFLLGLVTISGCKDTDPTPEVTEFKVELVDYTDETVQLKGSFFVYDANSDFIAIDLSYRLSPTGQAISIAELELEGLNQDKHGFAEFTVNFELSAPSEQLTLIAVGVDREGHQAEPVEDTIEL